MILDTQVNVPAMSDRLGSGYSASTYCRGHFITDDTDSLDNKSELVWLRRSIDNPAPCKYDRKLFVIIRHNILKISSIFLVEMSS